MENNKSTQLYFLIHDDQLQEGLKNLRIQNNPNKYYEMYFYKPKYVYDHLSKTNSKTSYLYDVYLPTIEEEPEFQITNGLHKGSFYVNCLRIGKRRDLSDVETFKYMVSQGTDLMFGKSEALVWACQIGNQNLVKYLLKQGLNINTQYGACLEEAASNGHKNVVKYLLKRGIFKNFHLVGLCIGGMFKAAENGHLSVVRFLYKKVEESKGHKSRSYNYRGTIISCMKNKHHDTAVFLTKKIIDFIGDVSRIL